MEVEKKGVKLSVMDDGNEGKSRPSRGVGSRRKDSKTACSASVGSGSGRQRRNLGDGLQDENEEVGSEGEGEVKEM